MHPTMLAGPLNGRRAYTDPIANNVANTSAHPLDVREALAEGRLAPEFLHLLIHETTHFWSYFSAVGEALAALMAAPCADPVGLLTGQDTLTSSTKVAIVADPVASLLTPLLEGLALFAEFNLAPGDAPVASTVSTVAARLFCALHKDGVAGYERLAAFVRENRLSSTGVDRKTALLKLPLGSGDGYLLGYLWLRRLWADLSERCPDLRDPDLFFQFICDYFFNDFSLAQGLSPWAIYQLKPDELTGFIEQIANYLFVQRAEHLSRHVESHVAAYVSYAVKARPGEIRTAPRAENRPRYQNYSAAAVGAIQMARATGAVRSRNLWWPNFLEGRHILRLFVAPATTEITETGAFSARTDGHAGEISGQALHQARPYDGSAITHMGTIEAMVLTDELRVILGVFLGHELVATLDVVTGEANDESAIKACDDISSYLALEAASVRMQEETEFDPATEAAAVGAEVATIAAQRGWDFYRQGIQFASATASREGSVLCDDGLAAALGAFGSDARWLARLSLSAAEGAQSFEDAAAKLQTSPFHLRTLVDHFNSAGETLLGAPIFPVTEDRFTSIV